MIGLTKINERLHDMTLNWMLLNGSVNTKKKKKRKGNKRYNFSYPVDCKSNKKNLFLIRFAKKNTILIKIPKAFLFSN